MRHKPDLLRVSGNTYPLEYKGQYRLVVDGMFDLRYDAEQVADGPSPGEGGVPRLQLLACRQHVGSFDRAGPLAGRSARRTQCPGFRPGFRAPVHRTKLTTYVIEFTI